MASKRKFNNYEEAQDIKISNKKHTLDSDEEDSDDYEKDDLNDSDIEGEEDCVATEPDEVKITPFNMREELQEGHFDKDGHYHWNKNEELRDNWLDNIDWVKVKHEKKILSGEKADDSDDSLKAPDIFDEMQFYSKVLEFMKPQETVQQTLQRLGKNRTKISSTERLRMKKLGIVDEAGEKITKFTELVNEIMTKTGNMDIYQETHAIIKKKIDNAPGTSKAKHSMQNSFGDGFDMYADDFVEKEQKHLSKVKPENVDDNTTDDTTTDDTITRGPPKWEFKWKQEDTELQGPFTTEQMLKWSHGERFKSGVYVRKMGETSNFYSSKRIDFDLYL